MKLRNFFLGLGGVLILAGILVSLSPPKAQETGSWGLHFAQEGQPPEVPSDVKKFRDLDAVYLGNTGEKVLYLTFDAGYENGTTAKILDILKAHQVPAAFFLAGNYLDRNPDLVRRMAEEGHIVGNHTVHHKDMTKISSDAEFQAELDGLAAKYQEITGQEMPKYYRPPQGLYNEKSLRRAQALGYRTVFWSLAYLDWDNDHQPTREQAFSKLISRIHDGAIVLLHCTSRTNGEILDELLTKWESMGYTFRSISEIFQ